MRISEEASQRVEELTAQGWELNVTWLTTDKKVQPRWEACFTRSLDGGFYDNHEEATGKDLSEVLLLACRFVKEGVKLGDLHNPYLTIDADKE